MPSQIETEFNKNVIIANYLGATLAARLYSCWPVEMTTEVLKSPISPTSVVLHLNACDSQKSTPYTLETTPGVAYTGLTDKLTVHIDLDTVNKECRLQLARVYDGANAVYLSYTTRMKCLSFSETGHKFAMMSLDTIAFELFIAISLLFSTRTSDGNHACPANEMLHAMAQTDEYHAEEIAKKLCFKKIEACNVPENILLPEDTPELVGVIDSIKLITMTAAGAVFNISIKGNSNETPDVFKYHLLDSDTGHEFLKPENYYVGKAISYKLTPENELLQFRIHYQSLNN